MQKKQHLMNDGRKIKPPKAPHSLQFFVQRTSYKSEIVYQGARPVLKMTNRTSTAYLTTAL